METLFVISLIGFIVGFLMSIPIAGPISIIILSNALKGNKKFCINASIGSAVADFIYVFIGIFGITKALSIINNFISWILLGGSIFILFTAIKIIKTKFDDKIIEKDLPNPKIPIKSDDSGGFRSGFFVNLLNPTLFFGWLTSTFVVVSFFASIGINTGELNYMLNSTAEFFKNEKYEQILGIDNNNDKFIPINTSNEIFLNLNKKYFPLLISIFYSFFLSFGSMLWFIIMTFLIIKFRSKINLRIISIIVKILGVCLFLIGFWLAIIAFKFLL